ncbi:MAG: lactate utilization protein [Oscillospiraceae bacterium]|nr:lactate utilization protein [Oscillospiraceae bacterium]
MTEKLTQIAQTLRANGFAVSLFETGAEAAAYLDRVIDGKTVGFGGSVTLRDMGLYRMLSAHNQIFSHMETGDMSQIRGAATAQVYLTSVNALAETGELINIDGFGNRIAASVYGHEKVYFVIGRNKLAGSMDEAIRRARNVAAPLNARRKQTKTPCAATADHCYDCRSPERICRAMTLIWQPMIGMESEIVLINEDLGF